MMAGQMHLNTSLDANLLTLAASRFVAFELQYIPAVDSGAPNISFLGIILTKF